MMSEELVDEMLLAMHDLGPVGRWRARAGLGVALVGAWMLPAEVVDAIEEVLDD